MIINVWSDSITHYHDDIISIKFITLSKLCYDTMFYYNLFKNNFVNSLKADNFIRVL